jgi:Predicted transcriptional regulators
MKDRDFCPYSRTMNIFGDKWSLLIIRDMMFAGKNTYGDFLKSPEGIATNILASKLALLEENGIIEKSEHPDSKAKVLYTLTQKGLDMMPVMAEIYIWSEKYYPIPDEIKVRVGMFKEDKEAAIKMFTDKIMKK